MTALRLLVTRPEPDATRTADELRAKGHDVMVAPMLNFEPTAMRLSAVAHGRACC